MKQTIRTFIAVEINAAVRQRTGELIEAFRAVPADVKWIDPHNMHLTLKFLGDVPVTETAAVCRAVERGAAEVGPFELELRGAGAFPNAQRPRTVWLGVGLGEPEMAVLHRQIEGPLKKLGYRPEHRRFHPHLTLGRVRRGGPGVVQLGELIEQHADFLAGRVQVGQVVVLSSQLDRAGPIYEVLGRAKCGR